MCVVKYLITVIMIMIQ